jgi:hypothetical protein
MLLLIEVPSRTSVSCTEIGGSGSGLIEGKLEIRNAKKNSNVWRMIEEARNGLRKIEESPLSPQSADS